MKIKIFCSFFFLHFMLVNAQIGINTEDPSASLDVLVSASSGTSLRISSSNNTLLTIDENGYAGFGSDSKTNLDLTGTDGIIGIGNSSQDASDAGAGAIRFNSELNILEYSDGYEWVPVKISPDKVFINANNGSEMIVGNKSDINYYTSECSYSGDLTGWTVKPTGLINKFINSFEPDTGIFTAPHGGLYNVSVTSVFKPIPIYGNGQFELLLSTTKETLKCVVPCVLKENETKEDIILAGNCQTVFFLEAGETIKSKVYFYRFSKDTSPQLSADAALNNITIAEI